MKAKNFAEGLKKLFCLYKGPDEAFFEALTDALIEGDIGAKTAVEVEDTLRTVCKREKPENEELVLKALYDILFPYVKTCTFSPEPSKVSIYLLLGVNGVGKTTSAAKMAHYYKKNYSAPIILAAGDTFRAAAIEQLKYHGEKLGIRVVAHKHGGDPGAVIFDAAEAAAASGGGLVLADTAGRLHNKENLVRELQKIDRIAKTKAAEGCYKKILVLDSTTGQNGLRQAEVFHNAVGVDAIFLTKYDSTAKGGVGITAGKEFGLPLLFTGTGEKYEDISPFSAEKYVREFIGRV